MWCWQRTVSCGDFDIALTSQHLSLSRIILSNVSAFQDQPRHWRQQCPVPAGCAKHGASNRRGGGDRRSREWEDLTGLVQSFAPDVVVVDFLSEGFDIDVVRAIKANRPATRILAITTQQSGHTLVNALKAGVDSYIKKDCDLGEVEDAIRETSKGGTFFCGQILDRIRQESIDVDDLETLPLSCDPIHLSGRETEVLERLQRG